MDIAVDIRPESATLENGNHFFWMPKKIIWFTFQKVLHMDLQQLKIVFSPISALNVYDKASESGLLWNDPDLNIDWQVTNPVVSDKDKELRTFQSIFGKKL